mgnify:CR=1 FL=1
MIGPESREWHDDVVFVRQVKENLMRHKIGVRAKSRRVRVIPMMTKERQGEIAVLVLKQIMLGERFLYRSHYPGNPEAFALTMNHNKDVLLEMARRIKRPVRDLRGLLKPIVEEVNKHILKANP